MKTTRMLVALAAMAFAFVAVFAVAESDDATGYVLKGYGATSDQDVDTVGEMTAFYWEDTSKFRLNIKLTTVPGSSVSVAILDKDGAAVQALNVTQSGSSIWVDTGVALTAAKSPYEVSVTAIGGDTFNLTSNRTISVDLNVDASQYYKVSFDANGGTGVMIDQYIPSTGANLNVENFTGATDEGTSAAYVFGGWNKDAAVFAYADASNLLADGASFTPTADTILYAEWKYTATYAENAKATGGAENVSVDLYTTATGQKIEAYPSTFTVIDDTTFKGWMTKTGTAYDFHSTSSEEMTAELIAPNDDVVNFTQTYYAIYEYTIAFNKNSENAWGQTITGNAETQKVLVDLTGLIATTDKLITTTAYATDHLSFIGWALDASKAGATPDYAAEADVDIVNAVASGKFLYSAGPLYAIWEIDTYKVTVISTNATINYIEMNVTDRTAAPATQKDPVPITNTTDSKVQQEVNFWDEITIEAHGNYVIKSIVRVIGTTSAIYTSATTPADDFGYADGVFTFKAFVDDVTLSVTDKFAMSVYNTWQLNTTTGAIDTSVKQDTTENPNIVLYYNDVVFDGTTGVLIIEKKTAQKIDSVKYYDMKDWKKYNDQWGFYSDGSGTPSTPTDMAKIAEGRYTIPFVSADTEGIAIEVKFSPVDKPYEDFYVSAASNNDDAAATATVRITSSTDAQVTWEAGKLIIKGTGYTKEVIGGENVVVYAPIAPTDFTADTTTGPTVVFTATATDLNVYYVYAQFTYAKDGQTMTDQSRGILAVDVYSVALKSSDGTDPIADAVLTGVGTYIDGSVVTVNAGTVTGKTFEGWYAATDTTFSEVICETPAYSFVINEDKSLVAKYN